MSRRFPDPHARLGCALANLAQGELIESRQIPWASATFSGARHHYTLLVPETPEPAHLSDLDEREFELPGHVLADIGITDFVEQEGSARVVIEALTVEDV